MDKKKIGEFLAGKRKLLGLDVTGMARRLDCHQSTIDRIERGRISSLPSKLVRIAQAYELQPNELDKLSGIKVDTSLIAEIPSTLTVTVEDLEFLLYIARGLKRSMSIEMLRAIIMCRRTI